ncbi:hypothetical protein RJT34_18691 [Clitoria ternatea]|uniref:Uncharacterized protein n=1 Tax=Clitoria ternatea TaxID=43366 RepID=A0AAN9JEG8_CLITE
MAIAAETNVSLQQQPNPTTFDTVSLLSFMSMDFERGPRYQAYAQLRERKLRMKYTRQEYEQECQQQQQEETKVATPPRKQVKFQGCGRKGSSLVAQSVPDFSAALRKENRKPVNTLPTVMELTPPSKKGCGVLSSSRGSKSANAGEKRRGVVMARKSYATIDELKNFSSATANAINGERTSRRVIMGKRTVLGYRQI